MAGEERQFSGESTDFSTNDAGTTKHPNAKTMNLDKGLTHFTKTNSK